jgi:hypothetical protein
MKAGINVLQIEYKTDRLGQCLDGGYSCWSWQRDNWLCITLLWAKCPFLKDVPLKMKA